MVLIGCWVFTFDFFEICTIVLIIRNFCQSNTFAWCHWWMKCRKLIYLEAEKLSQHRCMKSIFFIFCFAWVRNCENPKFGVEVSFHSLSVYFSSPAGGFHLALASDIARRALSLQSNTEPRVVLSSIARRGVDRMWVFTFDCREICTVVLIIFLFAHRIRFGGPLADEISTMYFVWKPKSWVNARAWKIVFSTTKMHGPEILKMQNVAYTSFPNTSAYFPALPGLLAARSCSDMTHTALSLQSDTEPKVILLCIARHGVDRIWVLTFGFLEICSIV